MKILLVLILFSTVLFSQDLEKETTKVLINALLTKSEGALVELLSRNNDKSFTPANEDIFDVIPCKTKAGGEIYLVLTNTPGLKIETGLSESFDIKKPEQLFKEKKGRRAFIENCVITVFDSKGKLITPFGGSNYIQRGILADLNNDGFIERVEIENLGVKGVEKARVLSVEQVDTKAVPLFSVLVDWFIVEEDDFTDWTFSIENKGRNGTSDILIGSALEAGEETQVRFLWSNDLKTWVCNKGQIGDHFAVLNHQKNLWTQLKELKNSGLKFKDHVAENQINIEKELEEGVNPVKLGFAKKYQTQDLSDMAVEELKKIMGEGKKYYELEREIKGNKAPVNFWSGDPKDIAMELVQSHRSVQHKSGYKIKLDDRDGVMPPEEDQIFYRYESSSCYTFTRENYFLKVDKNNSCLIYTQNEGAGVVFYNFIKSTPRIDIKFIPLDYKLAKQVADILFWLGKVRGKPLNSADGFSLTSTTADGNGYLLPSKALKIPQVESTIWFGYIKERWNENYNHETYVNFADFIFTSLLKEKLGIGYRKMGEKFPVKSEKALKSLFKEYTNNTPINIRVLEDAVELVEYLSDDQFLDSLKFIRKNAKPAADLKKRLAQITIEMDKDKNNWSKLYDEKKKLKSSDVFRSSVMYEMADSTIHKLSIKNNPEKLLKMAVKPGSDFQWALYRLQKYPKYYLEALEFWLLNENGKWAEQVFQEIRRANPKRAAELAKNDKSLAVKGLTVSAVGASDKSTDKLSKEQRREKLLGVIKDTSLESQQRVEAIKLLVPEENPLLDNSIEINDVLLNIIENENQESNDYLITEVAPALLRRNVINAFEIVFDYLKKGKGFYYESILQDLVDHYARNPKSEYRLALVTEIKKNLVKTNRDINKFIYLSWVLEIEELKERIAEMATSSADDVEDQRGSMHGGEDVVVEGRLFHSARKISSIWDEKDPYTKAVLIVLLNETKYRYETQELGQKKLLRELSLLKPKIPQEKWLQLKTLGAGSEKLINAVKEN